MPFANAASAGVVAGGPKLVPVNLGGTVKVALATFTFSSDAIGTYTAPELRFPAGAVILDVGFNLTASAGGTATLALGIAGTAGKYRAAATLTTTDQWVQSNLAAAVGVPLTAAEQWILTVAAAALPSSGTMLIRVLWVDNA